MNFRSLHYFLGIKTNRKDFKRNSHSAGLNPAQARRPIGHGGLLRQPAVTASRPNWRGPAATRPGRLGRNTARAHRPWSPRGGHAHGGGLARPMASNRVVRCGEPGGDGSRRKRIKRRARREMVRLTEEVGCR
jgi:hypothetical protein